MNYGKSLNCEIYKNMFQFSKTFRCVEQKLAKQIEMIQTPLADLGCEQAPPGKS